MEGQRQMTKASASVQIITDAKGAPVAAVVPWSDYMRMTGDDNEDAGLIAEATPHRDEEAFPADVARRLLGDEVPLRVFREWRNMSQAELGGAAGVPPQYISQIERGERDMGGLTASKLGKVLGVSVDALISHQYERGFQSQVRSTMRKPTVE